MKMGRMIRRISWEAAVEKWRMRSMLLVRGKSLEINGADGRIDEDLDVAEGRSQLRIEVSVAKIILSRKPASRI